MLYNNRRRFLSNLSILTAGIALGSSFTSFTPDDTFSPDLKNLWKNFCRQYSAVPSNTAAVLRSNKEIIPCKGHKHTEGTLVHFAGEDILARPIWIYWANNPNSPSDVVIEFYKGDKAIKSINQFELRALSEQKLSAAHTGGKALTVLLKLDQTDGSFIAKTIIENNRASIHYV